MVLSKKLSAYWVFCHLIHHRWGGGPPSPQRGRQVFPAHLGFVSGLRYFISYTAAWRSSALRCVVSEPLKRRRICLKKSHPHKWESPSHLIIYKYVRYYLFWNYMISMFISTLSGMALIGDETIKNGERAWLSFRLVPANKPLAIAKGVVKPSGAKLRQGMGAVT